MKKILSLAIICALVFSMFAIGGWAAPSQNTGEQRIALPDYHKLDRELVSDMVARGEKIKGKELKGDHSKAYMMPINGNAIQPLDVRTKNAKGIAILVDFPTNENGNSDVPGVDYPQVPADKFDDLLNGTEYNPFELDIFEWLSEYNGIEAPIDRTMRNYYKEVSYNQYKIQVDVFGWYELPKPYEYYLSQDNDYYNENGEAHIGELVLDAIKLADEDIDFSKYAIDGEVPNVFIIHRGTGAEYSTDPSIIWSHKWNILSALYYGYYYQTGDYMSDEMIDEAISSLEFDGVIVDTYNIVPEVGQDISGYRGVVRKPSPAYPGVYAHEFGHILGLPDQYDYGYESEGTGMFTLMAGGSYGNNMYQYFDKDDANDLATRQYRYYSGNTPVHMNAWDKFYLGFADPITITEDQSISLRPAAEEPDFYKIEVPGSDGREYFLLENRQQESYDEGLSYSNGGTDLHGLVVYHIIDDMIQKRFNRPNEAQNWDANHLGKAQQGLSRYGQTHYGMSVVQADGRFDLEKGNNDGDASDVFPGIFNITSLSSKGNNNANTTSMYKWSTKSTETGINLENIVEYEDGTITLDVIFTK